MKYSKIRNICISGLLMLAAGLSATAAPVRIGPFLGKDFGSLGVTSEAAPLVSSAYNFTNTFMGTITSSVWNLSSGDYLYLYQAANTGPSVLETLVVAPFYNIAEVGYLTSAAPVGYLEGGVLPWLSPKGYAVTYDSYAGGAGVSFGYPAVVDAYVDAGDHTAALYLISPNAPVLGHVHAIDHGTATAVGYNTAPVPEPSSLLALGLGLIPLAGRLRRNK